MYIANGSTIYRVTSSSAKVWQFNSLEAAIGFVNTRTVEHHSYRIDELEVTLTTTKSWGRKLNSKSIEYITP